MIKPFVLELKQYIQVIKEIPVCDIKQFFSQMIKNKVDMNAQIYWDMFAALLMYCFASYGPSSVRL